MRLTILQEPIPKARARTVVHNGRVMSFTPKGTRDAEDAIRAEIVRQKLTFDGKEPLSVSLLFVLAKPPSVPKKRARPITRPDLDNYVKLVMDACNGYLWRDDSMVCGMAAEKVYGEPPRIEIQVEPIL